MKFYVKVRSSTHVFFKHYGRIVFYLRIIDAGVKYRETYIGRALTLPEFRYRGPSRKLMDPAITEIRNKQLCPVRIEAQEYLLKFYESSGFNTVSQPFILEGISHVSMILYN